MLLDNTAWTGAYLITADFYRADHRDSYHIGYSSRTQPADRSPWRRPGAERKLCDTSVTDLGSLRNTPSAANIRRYAEIVRERSIMRSLAAIGTEIADTAFNPMGRDARALVDEAEAKVFRIAEAGAKARQGFVKIDPLLTETVERIDTLYSREDKDEVIGLATGFIDLDKITSGLQGGDLIIIAAPSMGKTSLAMNIVEQPPSPQEDRGVSAGMSGPQLRCA